MYVTCFEAHENEKEEETDNFRFYEFPKNESRRIHKNESR